MAKSGHGAGAGQPGLLAMTWRNGARAVDPRHEGTVLGLVVAAAIWLWISLVDAVLGTPFHTFRALGGVAVFTVAHVALCVMYGKVVAGLIHAAERAPSVIMGMVFGSILFQTACAMATLVIARVALPELPWVRLFGGSVVGSIVTFAWLSVAHDLAGVLHASEAER